MPTARAGAAKNPSSEADKSRIPIEVLREKGKLAQRAYRQRQNNAINALHQEVNHLRHSICTIFNAVQGSHYELLVTIRHAQHQVGLAVPEVTSEMPGPVHHDRYGNETSVNVNVKQRASSATPVGHANPAINLNYPDASFEDRNISLITRDRPAASPERDLELIPHHIMARDHALYPTPSIDQGTPRVDMPPFHYLMYDSYALESVLALP